MKDPEKELLDKYKVTKLPALLVMIADRSESSEPTEQEKKEGKGSFNLRMTVFTGKYNYNTLLSFFKPFSRKFGEEHKPHVEDTNPTTTSEPIGHMKKLNVMCEENCFILLINGNPENR
jgi:hypothetical protein